MLDGPADRGRAKVIVAQEPGEEAVPGVLPADATSTISRRESITAPPPDRTPHVGAALHRWGLLGRFFARLFFSKVFFPTEGVETIRKAAELGTVVYILRLRHTLEFLYFNYACTVHGLPLARFANGLRMIFWIPVRLLFRRWFGRDRREPIDTLRRLTRAHRSSSIFLRNHSLVPPPDFKGPYLEALIEAQRTSDRPIMLVPMTVLWRGSHKIRAAKGWLSGLDRLIGNQDEPRLLRRFWQVLRHASDSLAVVCEPLSLADYLAEREQAGGDAGGDEQLAEQLRGELLERIEAERRVRLGPHRAHFIQIRRRILDRPEVRTAMQQRAESTRQSAKRVRKQAWRTLKKMQAQLHPRGVHRLSRIIRWVWRRIFEGFEVDETGIERVREAGKSGPLIYLPSHRSHVDYLVMSDLLVARDLLPPHIAAGANLSFWPLGWLFRTSGAFFIRRRYHGDDLYAALLQAYVSEVLKEGHNIEVFIEGGRTRTGRLMPPRLGLLAMIADAVTRKEAPRAHVVPVSIGYERLVELTSLTRELTGGTKRPESVRGLFRAGKVVRTKRSYGYVNVQFGEPIDVGEFLAQRGYDDEAPPETRQRAIRSLGFHAISGAGVVTAVTPTSVCAAALLAPGTRGVREPTLRQAANVIAQVARTGNARFVSGVGEQEELSDAVIERAVEMLGRDAAIRIFGGEHDRIYVSEEMQRIRLEYYKNQLMQHLISPALVAMVLRALRRHGEAPFARQTVDEAARFAGSLVRLHFVNHAGQQIEELSEHTYRRLEKLQLITRDEQDRFDLAPAAEEPIALLAGLVENLIESHRATAEALLMLRAGPLPQQTAAAEVLGQLHRWYLTGELRRYETCQMPLVKIAIEWLREEGILEQRDDEIALAKAHTDGRALEVLVERTERMLPKPAA